jgi:hypothetical protein
MSAVRQALVALAAAAALAGSSVALAAASLTGIFTTTLKGKTPAALNGDWAILIKKSGDYQIAKRVGTSGQLLVTGHAKIAGAKITFQKETGQAACKGKQAVGRYAWSLKGKTLRFQRLNDKCSGRRTILGGTFTKVG